jgi:hypothetical protein
MAGKRMGDGDRNLISFFVMLNGSTMFDFAGNATRKCF